MLWWRCCGRCRGGSVVVEVLWWRCCDGSVVVKELWQTCCGRVLVVVVGSVEAAIYAARATVRKVAGA